MSEQTTEIEKVETSDQANSQTETQTDATDYRTLFEAEKAAKEAITKELKGFKNKAKDAEQEKAKTSSDVEQVRSWAEGEIKGWENRYNGLINNLVKSNLEREITQAISDAKGNSKLLSPHVLNRIKGEYQEDGSTKITVLGEDGNELFVRGKPATVKDLVSRMRESDDFAAAFQGSGATGSGTTNVVNTGMTASVTQDNPWMPSTRHVGRQMEIENRDPALAKKLKAQAHRK